MNKRNLIKTLIGAVGLGLSPLAMGKKHKRNSGGNSRPLLVQVSPLAGFQFYEGERLWPRMKPGNKVGLRRAPWNKHDGRAVEVWWHGNMLGHLPRQENTAVSQMMDRGNRLHGVIVAMNESHNPWERIALEVWHDSGM
ncbi:MAG: HIRAN domain-containing protein [Gammaproteobacteria bacterium]